MSSPPGASGRPLPPGLDPRGRPSRRRPAPTGPDRDRRSSAGRLGRVVRGLAATLSVLLLVGTGWIWFLRETAEQNLSRTEAIPAAGNSGGNGATNILLVGSDSRAGATDEEIREKLRTGRAPGMNTDTLLLVHIPADGGRASVVSLPRDSYVQIPEIGMGKLNAAYANGFLAADPDASDAEKASQGAQRLVQTVSGLSGLRIDHYVEVSMIGFYDLTQVIGGVEVNLCNAVQDPDSGIDLPAGVQTISGADALAFVRQRQGLPNGDLDRIVRQQAFIAGVIRKLISQDVLLNPFTQKELVTDASRSLTVDAELDLLDLAQQLQNLAAGNVDFSTVPIADPNARVDGVSVVQLEDDSVVREFFAGLSAPPTEPADTSTLPAGEVSVAIYNGSGVGGIGGQTRDELEQLGFVVNSVGNADRSDYTVTEIRFHPDRAAAARTLAAAILGSVLVENDALGADVELVLGSDFTGVGAPAAEPERPAEPADAEPPRTAADTACIN